MKLMINAPALERDGFVVLEEVISDADILHLIESVESARDERVAPGLRNLLRCEAVKKFATSGIAYKIAKEILGTEPLPVRGILFDKTPETNWYVTWHQDVSIPVANKLELHGYGPWSIKAGVLHVQPPASILEQMVSLRIHLDPCGENNGPIKFVAGSHRRGVLEPDQLTHIRDNETHTVCTAKRGDVIAMRPLILHSSSEAVSPDHRRVLHLEYAGTSLPSGLEWAEA